MSTTEQTYGGWYPTGTGYSGWQCGQCQQWVAFGAYHQCPSPITADERIASALERIAAHLERLERKEN